MPLSFVNPWMLAAAAAVAIPLLLHLSAREDRRGQAFPSLMFVRRSPFASRRRKTLRDRVLLALRCAALLLLALAFAGPSLPPVAGSTASPAFERDTVLLLDTSYSMATPARIQASTSIVERYIDGLGESERIALVAFATESRVIAPLSGAAADLRGRLAGLSGRAGATDFGPAFDRGNRLLQASPADQRRLVLISDLQRSALHGLSRLAMDAGVELVLEPVSEPVARNAAILSARLEGDERQGYALAFELRNTGQQALSTIGLTLEVDGRVVAEQSLALDPGEQRGVRLAVVPARDRAMLAGLSLSADDLAADNRLDLVLPPLAPLVVGLLTAERAGADVGVYFEQVARIAANPGIRLLRLNADRTLAARLAEPAVVIAEDRVLADPDVRAALGEFVDVGGGLWLLMADARSPVSAAAGAAYLPGRLGALHALDAATPELMPTAMTGDPWSGQRAALAAALGGTRVQQLRELDLSEDSAGHRVLARIGAGQPWLVERAYGQGRTLILTSGLDAAWGNLPADSGFLPLAQALIRYLAARPAATIAVTEDRAIDVYRQLAGLGGAAAWRAYVAAGGQLIVERPDGSQQTLPPGQGFYRSAVPGRYQIHRADGRPPTALLAINIDRSESLLEPASRDEFEQRVLRRTVLQPGVAAVPAGADTGARSLGPALLWAAAVLLLLEVWLANRLGRRRQSRPAVPGAAGV